MSIAEKQNARFEFHIISNSLVNPLFYLIDLKFGKKYGTSEFPDYVLDMMYANDNEFMKNYSVQENPNGWEPLCPKYGSHWKLCIPPEEKWLRKHPILRQLLQSRPFFSLELNGKGHDRYYRETVLEPLYQAAASC